MKSIELISICSAFLLKKCFNCFDLSTSKIQAMKMFLAWQGRMAGPEP